MREGSNLVMVFVLGFEFFEVARQIIYQPDLRFLFHGSPSQRTLGNVAPMSALPPIADILGHGAVGGQISLAGLARNHRRKFCGKFRWYVSSAADYAQVASP